MGGFNFIDWLKMDTKEYISHYPDVADFKFGAHIHYLLHGFCEGRQLSSGTDSVSSAENENLVKAKEEQKKTSSDTARKNEGLARIVRSSPCYDIGWYCNYYGKLRVINQDPALDYLQNCLRGGVNPGPIFYSDEYLLLNPDVKRAKVNPLYHYERHGKFENRPISLVDITREYVFDKSTTEFSEVFSERRSFDKHFVAVFASFSGSGRVEDYDLYYLNGLREICDYIVFVCDNPLFEDEKEKLQKYCDVCICQRHMEYDFGSYKRGYYFLSENDILKEEDCLIFANDSVYGPVYPFSEVINDFLKNGKDFYGLSCTNGYGFPIHSFFYIFRWNVFTSDAFKAFIDGIKRKLSPGNVIMDYEMRFTNCLTEAGFTCSSYIDCNICKVNPCKSPIEVGTKYRYPVVKIKALQGSSTEKAEDILRYINEANPELYDIIIPHIIPKIEAVKNKYPKYVNKYALYGEYEEKINLVREKAKAEKRIKSVFIVCDADDFSCESVMQYMLTNELFDVLLYVVPNVRLGESENFASVERDYANIREKYDFAKCPIIWDNDGLIGVNDVIIDADMVFFSSPYDISYSLYNPYYAALNGILSVFVDSGKYNLGIYSLDNYNNFYKVFVQTEDSYMDYKKYGQCGGINAEVIKDGELIGKYIVDNIR